MGPERAVALAVASEIERKERADRDTRDRLCRTAERRCQTAFIGALASFEERFSHLWEGRAPPEGFDAEAAWAECRAHILDNGNAQSRALAAEIALHKVSWEGHRTEWTSRR